MSLNNFLLIAALLFGIGIGGIVVNRRNVIALLMCIELILLAVNTNFLAFAHYQQDLAGQIFVFFILAIAAAEAAIGLAILMVLFRKRGNINVAAMNTLQG